MSLLSFYKKSIPSAPFQGTEVAREKYYTRLRWSSFLAATIGYSLYYVCRTSLNVVKKPIMEAGILDAHQLGIIGSALLFAYAIGKFVNGFLADHSNIKRFMATGLAVSTFANICVGALGFVRQGTITITTTFFFLLFAILWGINGWSQSMGASPAIVSLSRWFSLKQRGTFYGFFSASHNLGEFFSFLLVGGLVGLLGWQWGFVGASIAGVLGVIIILVFLHDTPESKGLPPVEVLAHEVDTTAAQPKQSVGEIQKAVLLNPYVWLLALGSAFMYVSRYAINGWGVLFLQEHKGFDLLTATQVVSVNALMGILGTVFSGWLSDVIFRGNRYVPAIMAGILSAAALTLFAFGGNGIFSNLLAMALFGLAIGILICFLGGLMAVDLVPREASGAALGVVGIASYAAAGLQDIVSGWLIDGHKTLLGTTNAVEQYVYDFTPALLFWIASALLSVCFVVLVWLHGRRSVS